MRNFSVYIAVGMMLTTVGIVLHSQDHSALGYVLLVMGVIFNFIALYAVITRSRNNPKHEE